MLRHFTANATGPYWYPLRTEWSQFFHRNQLAGPLLETWLDTVPRSPFRCVRTLEVCSLRRSAECEHLPRCVREISHWLSSCDVELISGSKSPFRAILHNFTSEIISMVCFIRLGRFIWHNYNTSFSFPKRVVGWFIFTILLKWTYLNACYLSTCLVNQARALIAGK